MFNNSLHHFRNVRRLLGSLIPQCLKPTGLLLVYEYVGPTRFQLPSTQRRAINEAIRRATELRRQGKVAEIGMKGQSYEEAEQSREARGYELLEYFG